MPRKDQLFVLMDANARTGKRDRGRSLEYAEVVGPYGRDVLNDNGEHLVRIASDAGMTIANRSSLPPTVANSPPMLAPKAKLGVLTTS